MKKVKSFNYIIYGIAFMLITLFLYRVPLYGDDIVNRRLFPNGIDIGKITSLVYNQYYKWSSRTLINFVMFIFESLPKIVFCIISGLLFCVLLHLFNQRFNKQNEKVNLLIILLAFLSFPIIYFSTAGWIATTTTYFFPIVALLYSYKLLLISNKSISKRIVNDIFATLLLTYSFNNEQLALCAIVVITFMFPVLLENLKKYKIEFFVIIVSLLVNILWIIKCPGNKIRNISESRNFVGFNHLTVINKFDIGIISTIQHYFFGMNLPIIILSFAIFFVSLERRIYLNKGMLIFGYGPAILITFTNVIHFFAYHFNIGTSFLNMNRTGFLTNIVQFYKDAIFQYSIGIIWLCLVIAWLWKFLPTNNKRLLATSSLLGGIASRVAMGFSPTVYASSTRTCVILSFILLILAVYLLCNYIKKERNFVLLLLSLLCIFNIGITYLNFFEGHLLIKLWAYWVYVSNP